MKRVTLWLNRESISIHNVVHYLGYIVQYTKLYVVRLSREQASIWESSVAITNLDPLRVVTEGFY